MSATNTPAAAAHAATGPLAGVRVLDLTQFVLGPLCSQILGDMGADIIKIEAPQGDLNRYIGPERYPGMAALFMGMNRNKRSVVMDLRRPEARDMLRRMVADCDVFMHSLRPDAAARLGIDAARITALNPRLIYASAPGYRSDGPKRAAPAYDDVIQGESGIAGLAALTGDPPRYLPTIIADKFCGYVLASAIAMALYHRERTGQGQVVEVPMLETMLSFNLVEHLWTGNFDAPMGPLGYERAVMPHRRPFATLDGYICLMATSDQQWANLFKALGRPELCEEPRYMSVATRSAHFPEIYGVVADEIGKRTTAEWEMRLAGADIPHARAKTLQELPTDPYLVETGYFHHYAHPQAGPIVTTSIPVKFSNAPPQIRRPPPTLGEHTEEVLREFGFEAGDIAPAHRGETP